MSKTRKKFNGTGNSRLEDQGCGPETAAEMLGSCAIRDRNTGIMSNIEVSRVNTGEETVLMRKTDVIRPVRGRRGRAEVSCTTTIERIWPKPQGNERKGGSMWCGEGDVKDVRLKIVHGEYPSYQIEIEEVDGEITSIGFSDAEEAKETLDGINKAIRRCK